MKKLILTIAIVILLSVSCSGGNCPTEPYEPTIGPLNPESEWMEGMDWACPRGYKDEGCGQCHILY